MSSINQPEVWLRGSLPGITPALQPVAHALLQAKEEVNMLVQDFPDELLWQQPANMASPGFHLQHMAGVLDRLFTYANAQMLSESQLVFLLAEGKPVPVTTAALLEQLNARLEKSIIQLQNANTADLFEARGVGRAQLPSTVIGLLVHAAEHTMRHLGQLLVTVKVLNSR